MPRVYKSRRYRKHLGTRCARMLLMRTRMDQTVSEWWEREGIVRCYELGSRASQK